MCRGVGFAIWGSFSEFPRFVFFMRPRGIVPSLEDPKKFRYSRSNLGSFCLEPPTRVSGVLYNGKNDDPLMNNYGRFTELNENENSFHIEVPVTSPIWNNLLIHRYIE